MENIIRGTTPTFNLDFTGLDISVSDITEAVLVITHQGEDTVKELSDLAVDTTNEVISYHFSQAETLAFTAKKAVRFEFTFIANGERYRGFEGSTQVYDTKYEEEL